MKKKTKPNPILAFHFIETEQGEGARSKRTGYFITFATVDDKIYAGRSKHDSIYELALRLIDAGIPDAPMKVHSILDRKISDNPTKVYSRPPVYMTITSFYKIAKGKPK
jgi:hypothetical protein